MYGDYGSGSSRRRRRGLLAKLWSAVTWPFRAIEQLEARVVAWADSRRRNFRQKYRHSKVMAPLVGTIVWGVLLPFRLVWQFVTAPFRLIGATSRTMSARRSRQWMHLLQGVPAVVAGIGVFVVLMMLTTQAEELPLEYLQRAQSAYNSENFHQAEVYLHRALQLNPDSDQASYLLARTLEHNGQPQRALAILDSLAPDDRRGDARAHLRKAEIIFGQLRARSASGDPEAAVARGEWERLLRHIEQAESGLSSYSAVQRADLDYFRGFVQYHMGETEKARESLERASRHREELNIMLAGLYDDLSSSAKKDEKLELAAQLTAKARQKRELARAHLQNRLNENAGDSDTRIELAGLVLTNQDYGEAVRLLEEGRRLNPDDERLQKVLAEVFVFRSLSLPRGSTAQIKLLDRALKIDPNCTAAIHQLLQLGSNEDRQVGSKDERQEVRNVLEDMIALGSSAPLAHFALGVMAWEEQDLENAVWHLERAYKLDPELAVVGNNLAWLLAHDEENPQPERALVLINSVLESRPDQLSYVETRGQIYVRLGRWEEALDDLERALPRYNYTVEIHESLAKVYENLGQASLAQKHRNVAANLQRMGQGTR
jgi:tetratricopeptide (TPR) repeat protein